MSPVFLWRRSHVVPPHESFTGYCHTVDWKLETGNWKQTGNRLTSGAFGNQSRIKVDSGFRKVHDCIGLLRKKDGDVTLGRWTILVDKGCLGRQSAEPSEVGEMKGQGLELTFIGR